MPSIKGLFRKKILIPLAIFIGGILFAAAFSATLEYTNTTEFCVSCHTMQTNYLEYQDSLHYKNPSGVQASCADCHVAKPLIPKMVDKVIAIKDVYHEIVGTINTPEKFEARRWHMATVVWDKMERTDSRECRTCHELKNMDLSEQGRSARLRHSRAEDQGQTCIECHKAFVHNMPVRPDD